MDWYLDGTDPRAARALRHDAAEYLARHAADGADIDSAMLAFEELVANAVRHAGPHVWVSLTWPGDQPLLAVRDLGPGFEPRRTLPDDVLAEGGRGLFLVSHLTDELRVASRRGAGAVAEAVLAVTRRREQGHDPPRHHANVLPDLSEAGPDGFGRESFLRALVVQLAQAVERNEGPDVADAAVAQVGIDVGGQMEAEYRRARGVAGRLTPAQLAECFVRLKHAIDGGFSVIEATPERIVLANTRCPFGDAVRRAPALCRMTSSVFGGIAARNVDGGASVVLEERIAVGDPGCRVVVHLGGRAASPAAHRYETPVR